MWRFVSFRANRVEHQGIALVGTLVLQLSLDVIDSLAVGADGAQSITPLRVFVDGVVTFDVQTATVAAN